MSEQGADRKPRAAEPSGVRPRRLAEMVADQIRERILRGDLAEGDLLPKEAELREQYPVNVQSLREAMRILEAEGLVQVRRGNRGGAVVHRPTPGNVAYSLSMVLAMSGTDIDDVGRALDEVEPMCAALCAERKDRATEVVPVLRALHEESLRKVDDLVAATTLSRRFHEAVVQLCGNRSLIVLAGALESLWSSHVTDWANERADPEAIPQTERRQALAVHGQILQCIEDGDAASARVIAARHLRDVQTYPHDPARPHVPLDPAVARDRLFFG
ncbi:FadR/GntR family transcriptional regulator [Rhodococcus sp. ACT016]|uniref:FadR/GntR family transcriptional regulator n=1 Tax=Rhodococcus sp. ACT016 TaxID=3134808 RepID=UPI003D27406F